MLPPLGVPGRNIFAGLRPLRENERLLDRAMERLATGKLINSGKDDPAGLIAGLHLDAAIRALDAESRALQRRADVLATEDGALAATADMAAELHALAVEAAGSTLSDTERQALEVEAASIVRAIEHTAGAADFAGEKLFEGALTGDLGATEGVSRSGDQRLFALADVGRDLSLAGDAALVAQIAEKATNDIATMRAEIGSEISHEIEPRSGAVDVEMVRLAQAHSLILDADYTREVTALMLAETLTQASRYLLALDSRNSALALNLLAGAA